MSDAPNYILLLGAGFTRNWGGYLADEIPGKLMGSMFFNDELRGLLEKYRTKGGFESALDEVQQEYRQSNSDIHRDRLERFEKALSGMLLDMNESLHEKAFEWQNEKSRLLLTFLVKFDAIFSLNYDTLLESHYINSGNVELADFSRWRGAQQPGIKPQTADYLGNLGRRVSWFEPTDKREVSSQLQPYFKLHGSSNWRTPDGRRLIVAGGKKTNSIQQVAILEWYQQKFVEYLGIPKTRLMVIGYGFGDKHINDAIEDAASRAQLTLHIVDTRGLNAMSPNGGMMGGPSALQVALTPHVRHVHQRLLPQIFGDDLVAHRDILKFFA